jgi:hypothetical protein
MVLSVAYIVVGNYFPRAAPDRQAEQDSRCVLREAAAFVEKKSNALDAHHLHLQHGLFTRGNGSRAAMRPVTYATRLRFRHSAITRKLYTTTIIAQSICYHCNCARCVPQL